MRCTCENPVGGKNRKIGTGGKVSFDLSAGRPEFGGGCLFMTDACRFCYAQAGEKVMTSMGGAHAANTELAKRDPEKYADIAIHEIVQEQARRRRMRQRGKYAPPYKLIRIHGYGDFLSAGHVHAWVRIARAFPGIRFFGTTRAWQLYYRAKGGAFLAALEDLRSQPNVFLGASIDDDTRHWAAPGRPRGIRDSSLVPWLKQRGWNIWNALTDYASEAERKRDDVKVMRKGTDHDKAQRQFLVAGETGKLIGVGCLEQAGRRANCSTCGHCAVKGADVTFAYHTGGEKTYEPKGTGEYQRVKKMNLLAYASDVPLGPETATIMPVAIGKECSVPRTNPAECSQCGVSSATRDLTKVGGQSVCTSCYDFLDQHGGGVAGGRPATRVECSRCGSIIPKKVQGLKWAESCPCRMGAQRNPGEILDSYHARRGDRITFELRDDRYAGGVRRGTGTVVMASGSGDGWVLNMGGAHGTPQVIRHEHVVRVTRPKSRAGGGGLLGNPSDDNEWEYVDSAGNVVTTFPDSTWRETHKPGCGSPGCGGCAPNLPVPPGIVIGKPIRPNPAPKRGDVVMASAAWLRSAGMYTGPEAFTKWRVKSVGDLGGLRVVTVESLGGADSYPKGTVRKFNDKCLVLADKRHLEPNPPLILVHAMNPPIPADIERSWCNFHQRDRYTGKTRDIGKIPGTPDFTFALGRCEALEIGGKKCTFSKRPWVVCSPDDQSIWIVAEEPMNIGSGMAGRKVSALTYDPVSASGKDKNAVFRHEFDSPHPTLDPIGRPAWCRAILLQGGRYKVTDWIHN